MDGYTYMIGRALSAIFIIFLDLDLRDFFFVSTDILFLCIATTIS